MMLIDAIYITCSLPFIFQPIYIDNTYLIDGGVLYNYPLDICIEHEKAEKSSILGIDFKINTTNKTKIDENTNMENIPNTILIWKTYQYLILYINTNT